jgi:hypothetical protein
VIDKSPDIRMLSAAWYSIALSERKP